MATRAKSLGEACAIKGGITHNPQKRREAIAEALHILHPDLRGKDFEETLDKLVRLDTELLKVEG